MAKSAIILEGCNRNILRLSSSNIRGMIGRCSKCYSNQINERICFGIEGFRLVEPTPEEQHKLHIREKNQGGQL